MSFYVRRVRRENWEGVDSAYLLATGRPDKVAGYVSWVGPIRSPRQAKAEVRAWDEAGWDAEALESTPEVRAAVEAWLKARARR